MSTLPWGLPAGIRYRCCEYNILETQAAITKARHEKKKIFFYCIYVVEHCLLSTYVVPGNVIGTGRMTERVRHVIVIKGPKV